MTGFFGYTNSAGPGLTPEALADVKGWSPAAETEVRTARAIPTEVKQQLKQAVEQQVTECKELTEDGAPSCALLDVIEPVERVVSGEVPEAFDSVEVTAVGGVEVNCGAPQDRLDASEYVSRAVECTWTVETQRTHFDEGASRQILPATVTCTLSPEIEPVHWGGCGVLEDSLSQQRVTDAAGITRTELNCAYAEKYGPYWGYEKCAVPVQVQDPRKPIAMAEVAGTWSTMVAVSAVW